MATARRMLMLGFQNSTALQASGCLLSNPACSAVHRTAECADEVTSGMTELDTPRILPIRGNLKDIMKLMKGDVHIGLASVATRFRWLSSVESWPSRSSEKSCERT